MPELPEVEVTRQSFSERIYGAQVVAVRLGKPLRWPLGVAPERLVWTEKFDQSWYPGEAVGTLVLVERGGKTTLTQTMLYESREARDAVLASPMEEGVAASYDRLEELLAGQPAG